MSAETLIESPALFWLSVIILFSISAIGLEFLLGHFQIKFLKDLPPMTSDNAPRVSIIAAARNEECNIEEAVRSLLAQDYPNFEVILVNDRSTDRTGEILDRLATSYLQLRVIHITELPSGWLGKNHAQARAAESASGELLLFTDGDVVMEPTSLRRAVRYLQDHRLDHIAIAPNVDVRSPLVNIFVSGFVIFFAMFVKPWRVRNPKSAAHIGIGAFNLLRTDVYRQIGAHRAIAMRVDDDLKLGKLVKKHGFRQDLLAGRGMIFVEWYSSTQEVVRGLTKNMFAGVEYRLSVVAAATIAQLLVFVWPFLAVWATGGLAQLFNGLSVLFLLTLGCFAAHHNGIKPYYALGFPLAVLLFLYILWRSALVTLWNGGVNWRGTHYSLKELRANKI